MVYGNGANSTVGSAVNTFLVVSGGVGFDNNESDAALLTPITGTLRNLRVGTAGVQGAGALTITVRTCSPAGAGTCTGSPTAITITIAGGSGADVYSDLTHTAAVTVGDEISINFVQASGSTSGRIKSVSMLLN